MTSQIDQQEIEHLVESLYTEIEGIPDTDEGREIRSRYRDGEFYKQDQLTAALTVLSKEMAEYLAVSPREDSQLFFDVYTSSLDRFHQHSYKGKQVRRPLDNTELPSGVIERAVEGDLSSYYYAEQLSDPVIIHEWTTDPGKQIAEELAERFDHILCDDVHPAYQNQSFGKVDLPALITSKILSEGFNPDTFWIPISVCFSMVVAQRGLDHYCSEDESE